MKVQNKKIDEDKFFEQRKQVLAMWPTGKDVDIEDAVSYHKNMPDHKNIVNRLQEAKKTGYTLFHTMHGVGTFETQKELLLYLQNEGRCDFLHCIYDSFTRTLRFEGAAHAIKESERTGKNMLNGFPVVNYGVPTLRKLIETVDRPMSGLGPTVDSRLAAELCLASGYSECELNTFIVFETYTKTVPLEEIIAYTQYCARLVGYYHEKGVSMSVLVPNGAGGDNAPGIAPPSLGTSGTVLGALLAAEQGVKHLRIKNDSHGNLAQDVACSITRTNLVREYLDRFGYTDVELYKECGCLGGQYPLDFDEAFAEVLYAPVIAALAGAQTCQLKTFDESSSIPTKENQARSLRGCRSMYNIMKAQNLDFANTKEVKTELEVEAREVRAIVDKVLELGDGDPCVGAVKAYEYGILDNPVANNPRVKAKVMGVKDSHGAVRYLDCGNLPFTKETMEFHRGKIAEREKSLGKKADYDTVVADIRAIANGLWLSR